MSRTLNLLNIYDFQQSPYQLDSLELQKIVYYGEVHLCAALRAIQSAGSSQQAKTEIFHRELVGVLC